MKVIDLLNKIANGEEVPKRINYGGMVNDYEYLLNNLKRFSLNDEIEIIEDTPKIDDAVLRRYFTDKENKKIEKFKVIKDNSGDSVQLVYDDMNLNLTLLQAIILDKINEIIDKVNGE